MDPKKLPLSAHLKYRIPDLRMKIKFMNGTCVDGVHTVEMDLKELIQREYEQYSTSTSHKRINLGTPSEP